MGSLVEYRCTACDFTTGKLTLGWGKAGRGAFWGGLASCPACRDLGVVDLAQPRSERRDRRCTQCNGPLTLLEGIAATVPCPRCGATLRHANLGSWT
ncbi:MAG: hypothetical protein U0807_17685 [Candidatus Binatia bacterium]